MARTATTTARTARGRPSNADAGGRSALNYRHAFHAGNFADLVKHAVLLAVLARLKRDGAPLSVVDTHAGAGAYRLDDASARRSGEAEAGVARLMATGDLPPAMAALADAVRRFNGSGALARYPGSPPLILSQLAAADRYLGCELRPDDHASLCEALRPWSRQATSLQADGYVEATRRLRSAPGRTLLLVDPPFERADDYARTAELVAARARPRTQPALIWTPLKDLETFDGFLGRLEALRPGRLTAMEVRLRPLDDPMRLNGCAMVMVDGPDVSESMLAVGRWVAGRLGEPGGGARVVELAGPAT